jgi:hypothetical protein
MPAQISKCGPILILFLSPLTGQHIILSELFQKNKRCHKQRPEDNAISFQTFIFLVIIIYLLTAIGLIPGGSGYFTCIQNMKLITTKFKSGGLHEKNLVALGKLGTTSAFAFRHRETKKNLRRGGRS